VIILLNGQWSATPRRHACRFERLGSSRFLFLLRFASEAKENWPLRNWPLTTKESSQTHIWFAYLVPLRVGHTLHFFLLAHCSTEHWHSQGLKCGKHLSKMGLFGETDNWRCWETLSPKRGDVHSIGLHFFMLHIPKKMCVLLLPFLQITIKFSFSTKGTINAWLKHHFPVARKLASS